MVTKKVLVSVEGALDALNDYLKAAYADGTLIACAEAYGVQAALIAQ